MAELPSASQIRAVAREVLSSMIAPDAATDATPSASATPRSQRELVNESMVLAAKEKGVLVVPEGSIVTPLARDAAERFAVEIRFGGASEAPRAVATKDAGADDAAPAPERAGGVIALGADHGGFKLKEALKRHLEAKRFSVADHGTSSEASCDYPDFAARVAGSIALGKAAWGVIVDGAGIGSCMAANKVPGVLAATCCDEKAAKNAREHNGANVLCLGAGFVDEARAKSVLDAFLATGFGGGRHGRRVEKIRALERAFLR